MLLSISCNEPVDLNNPFDPDFTIPQPVSFLFAGHTDSTQSFVWENPLKFYNKAQEESARTIIVMSIHNDVFVPIDSTAGTATGITMRRIYGPDQGYYFGAYFRVGARRGNNSHTIWIPQGDWW